MVVEPEAGGKQQKRPVPRWVWAIILVLASIEPLEHFWIKYAPSADAVPTGLHFIDSLFFLQAMRALDTDFFSPYATCQSPRGSNSPTYFPLTDHYMYMGIGAAGRFLGIDPFMTLGLTNAAGAIVFLLAAYFFLRVTAPKQADLAFLLYTVGGGLGGILYVAAGLAGLHDAAQFETYFMRYAKYELMEGGMLSPLLFFGRQYYTLSLACCLGGFAAFILFVRDGSRGYILCALPLFFFGTFINLRYGVLVWGLALLFLACHGSLPVRRSALYGLLLATPVLLGLILSTRLMSMNPTYATSYLQMLRSAMELSPFISRCFFHLFILPFAVYRLALRLPRHLSIAAFGTCGYIVGFGVLYAAYQVYYGNFLLPLDVTVAIRMSDWALLGVPAGLVYGFRRTRNNVPCSADERVEGWIVLWLLFFFAIAISAFGQGWFLRLLPSRLAVLLALPISIVTAEGLLHLQAMRPRLAKTLQGMILGCGATSIAIASLYFQGPLGHRPGSGTYAYLHHEYMTRADAGLLEHLPPGTLLCPATPDSRFGDIAALRPGVSTVCGVGTSTFSNQSIMVMLEAVHRFFSSESTEADRRAFVEAWCVDYVLCPDTPPVAANVLGQLRSTPWLRPVAQRGRGVLFRVERIDTASGEV